jgi:hypothetical protein
MREGKRDSEIRYTAGPISLRASEATIIIKHACKR